MIWHSFELLIQIRLIALWKLCLEKWKSERAKFLSGWTQNVSGSRPHFILLFLHLCISPSFCHLLTNLCSFANGNVKILITKDDRFLSLNIYKKWRMKFFYKLFVPWRKTHRWRETTWEKAVKGNIKLFSSPIREHLHNKVDEISRASGSILRNVIKNILTRDSYDNNCFHKSQ